MSPFIKRAGVLAIAALALGACEFSLNIPDDAVQPGATVPITNEGLDTCPTPPPTPSAVGDPDEEAGTPVAAWVITNIEDFATAPTDPTPDVDTFTDADGIFKGEVTAPDRPGVHLVFAECDGDTQAPEISPEAVNEDGTYVDFIRVAHSPLTIALSDDSVEKGATVTATFPACQDDNDLGLSDPDAEPVGIQAAAEPTQDELNTDYPDLQVFLDGELVDTVEGTERYPTEDIKVPVKLDEVGDHAISGVCTYQTFDVDEAALEGFFSDVQGGSAGGVQSAAIEYPFSPEDGPFTYDETTSEAAAPVTVTAVAVAPTEGAKPVAAQPTFTG